ncbi:MAG TPA: histone deacetylase [Dehalococcoidia bacterium]|nr:histone deacetylase [Dehalococcoidia bacterium]
MRKTGIFYHYQQGERLRDFPRLLEGILDKPNVFLYDAIYPLKPRSDYDLEAAPSDLLSRVHTPRMLDQVARSPYYETALYSAGGTVQAAELIWRGEIDNAFVFTGVGDHHAGRDFFGGGCYLNGAALAIAHLRGSFGARRFAIVDTDAHHGDGTWDIFQDDPEVLYVCFCSGGNREHNNKLNVSIPGQTSDEEYLSRLEGEFGPRARAFCPQLIFWNWGYDNTRWEYGDMGLSPRCHEQMAERLQSVAEEVCQGRLLVVLCGGSGRDVAGYAIPGIIRRLANLG